MTHEQYTAFENIKFNPDCLKSLLGVNGRAAAAEMNVENVDPNENYLNCREENQDIVYKREEANQNIFCILKNWKCHGNNQGEKFVSLGQKSSECSFQEYIEQVSTSINDLEKQKVVNPNNLDEIEGKNYKLQKQIKEKQEEVYTLLLDIFGSICLLHSQKISLESISLENLRILKFENHIKVKIVSLSAETIDKDAKKKFTNDINNLGKLYLAMITLNEQLRRTLNNAERQNSYESLFGYLQRQLSYLNWIEPYRKKLFADLILYLIKIDDCDSTTILKFKKHPFFWDESDIEDFLRIINCRLDLQDKEKIKQVTRTRIEKLNEEFKEYNDWEKKIGPFLSSYTQQPSDTSSKIFKCNDLIKFIRNKIAHKDDDTDNEDLFSDKHQPQESSSNQPSTSKQTCQVPPVKHSLPSENSSSKKSKNLAQLWTFFNNRGGPLNYFLHKFPDLIYQLFHYYRKFHKHKKIKQFYPDCMRKVLPKQEKDKSSLTPYPPPDKDKKNKAIANDAKREAREINYNKKKSK